MLARNILNNHEILLDTNHEIRYFYPMDIKNMFQLLKEHTGSHKAAARFIGMSYTRYNEWRYKPQEIPAPGLRLLEFAVKSISHPTK
jgi:hypothetical protein